MSLVMRLVTGRHHAAPVARRARSEVQMWDCALCGTKAVAASLTQCPTCNAKRGAKKPSPAAKATPPPAPAPAAKADPDPDPGTE